MKKSLLLLGTVFLVGSMGIAQSQNKKTVNPKHLQKFSVIANNKTLTEPAPNTFKNSKVNTGKSNQQKTASACANTYSISTSWNCFGVGGGANTSTQNCLSYNSDLNCLIWTQRGQVQSQWPLITSSGFMEATIINATTLVKDSVILYNDLASLNQHARYPSGTFINPLGNTDYHKAIAIGIGTVTDNTNWIGTAYVAKPLWSKSAVTHATPSADSLYTPAQGGLFGNDVFKLQYEGSPSTDVQALNDGKTFVSIGSIGDHHYSCSDCNLINKAVFVKGVVDNTGKVVNWSADSTSLVPDVHKGLLGYQLGQPRVAFGPDGMHGYVVFLGRLNTVYGNPSADSAMTPIVYKTVDGGTTWTQVLAGYDWMQNHPEVEKNVGELVGMKRYYTFDEFLHGSDLTVDANNVLHFVTCVDQSSFQSGNIDSLGIYSNFYQYDYVDYHPIIWDFMTDGSCWSTMMVDSIITAACGKSTNDSTSLHTPMAGAQPLSVSSHISVSRSLDGTKVFYGWADSDPNITSQVYNVSPDILMKAYDISTGNVSATKNVTNGLGTCFYPFLSDISYFDGTNWVVPAVYTTGDVVSATTPDIIYDASSQADYYLTNCGTFNPVNEITISAPINHGLNNCTVSIKQNKSFESLINNYPNPFTNSTTILVTLTESTDFEVKIYNALGAQIFNKKVNGNIGENQVIFDGSALNSGIYYYSIKTDNQQVTKKMIVQK